MLREKMVRGVVDHGRKLCSRCHKAKNISEFSVQTSTTSGLRPECKKCGTEDTKRYSILYPWMRAYCAARNRCLKTNQVYYKKGIKFLMNKEDFKTLWYRDKAYIMKHPSIDRIDPYGNYTFENCRYLEWRVNTSKPKIKVLGCVSVFKGVTVDRYSRWIAQINHKNKHYAIGTFNSEKEAAIAFNKKATELYGNDAILNKVEYK